jgi:hypothetical protein
VAAGAVGGTLGVLALVGGEDSPNDATRSGCWTMADIVTRMDPDGSNRAQIRSLIGAAMVEFRDSNDDVIRDAAADVEQAYTSLDDSLYSSSIRAVDNRCREHYAAGWRS